NLEGSSPHARVLGHQVDRVVEVLGLKDQDSAQLLLGLSVGAVGDQHFSALEPQCGGVSRGLQRIPARKVTVLPKHVVVRETLVNKSIPLAFGHPFPLLRIHVPKTDVFHGFLPVRWWYW